MTVFQNCIFFQNWSVNFPSPLQTILNRNLHENHFASLLKEALMISIHKTASLHSACSKILEGCSVISCPRNFGHLIMKEQLDFVKHTSTESNLLCFTNFVTKCLNSRQERETIYFSQRSRLFHEVTIGNVTYQFNVIQPNNLASAEKFPLN